MILLLEVFILKLTSGFENVWSAAKKSVLLSGQNNSNLKYHNLNSVHVSSHYLESQILALVRMKINLLFSQFCHIIWYDYPLFLSRRLAVGLFTFRAKIRADWYLLADFWGMPVIPSLLFLASEQIGYFFPLSNVKEI